MKKIDIVQWDAGDWIALYVDGKLVHEGHSIRGVEMLEYLNIPFDKTEVPDNEDAFMLCGIKSLATLQDDLMSGRYRLDDSGVTV
jgi:hypothetical protein